MKFPTQVREEPNHPVLSITAMIVYKQQSLVRSSKKFSGYVQKPYFLHLHSSMSVDVFDLPQKQRSRYVILPSFAYILPCKILRVVMT